MLPLRLVVAMAGEEERQEISGHLVQFGCLVVGQTGDGVSVLNLNRSLQPDAIILGAHLSGLPAGKVVEQILSEHRTGLVMVVETDQVELARSWVGRGVSGCLLMPVNPGELLLAVEIAARQQAERLALTRRALTAERRLAERQLVERAKALLMEQEGITEHEAYRRLQRLSMESRSQLGSVAHTLLLAYSQH